MGPPEVFVRELVPEHAQRLKRLSKSSKSSAVRERALILLASNTLMSAPQIARMLLTDESHVRKVTPSATRSPTTSVTATTPPSANAASSKPPPDANAAPPRPPSPSSSPAEP